MSNGTWNNSAITCSLSDPGAEKFEKPAALSYSVGSFFGKNIFSVIFNPTLLLGKLSYWSKSINASSTGVKNPLI